jgi:hypothetical protein
VRRHSLPVPVLAVAAGILIFASTAFAQERQAESPRRVKPLFDPAGEPPRRLSFDLTGMAYGGYGDALDAAGGGGQGAGAGKADFYSGTQVGASLSMRGRRNALTITGGTGVRYEMTSRKTTPLGMWGGANLDLAFGRSTRVQVSQGIRQTPFQQLVSFLAPEGQSIQGGSPDSAFSPVDSVTHLTTAGLARTFGRRIEVSADYGSTVTTTSSGEGANTDMRWVGGRLRYMLGRSVAFRVGHTMRMLTGEAAQDPGATSATAQDLDLGLELGRTFTIARGKTTFGFSTGSSIVKTTKGRQLHVVGTAGLDRPIGRSWAARGTYERKLEMVQTFTDPVMRDTAGLSLGGYFGRRLGVRFALSATTGQSATAEQSERFMSYQGEARASFALGRRWQLFAEQFYYRHEIPEGALRAGGIVPSLSRMSTRVGLDMRFPMLQGR